MSEEIKATDWKGYEKSRAIILKYTIDGFWTTDTGGKILEVNDAYCSLIGYSRDELYNMNLSDLEISESGEDVIKHIQQLKASGSARFETRHKRKDGTFVDIEVSMNLIDVDGGRIFAFFRDITERKKYEKKLLKSEGKYRNLLESLNEEVWGIDENSYTTFANPKMADPPLHTALAGRHILLGGKGSLSAEKFNRYSY